MQISCPGNMAVHVEKVIKGEYDIPYNVSSPVILDIGSNVGSFAAWAIARWPTCFVHCYEPLPSNFAFLQRNLGDLEGQRVRLNNFAIGNPANTRLYLGKNNCGEASFYDMGEQSTDWVEVETKSPEILPRAQILKMDTEGSELDILSRMTVIDFDAVMLEYHSEDNRRGVDKLLGEYVLVGGEITCLNRGVLKYLHRRLLLTASLSTTISTSRVIRGSP